MSILFDHYNQLNECIEPVEKIETSGRFFTTKDRREKRILAAYATAVKVIRILKFLGRLKKE